MTQVNTTNKVITGEVRFFYVHVFTPDAIDGAEPKYSVSLLIDKADKDTCAAIGNMIRQQTAQAQAQFGGRLPAKFAGNPIHDGDVEKPDDASYKGCWYINAKSTTKPGLLKLTPAGLVEITEEDDFYSGCYGRASISFYVYNKAGNTGIGVGLNNLLKTRDGEYLGGRASAMSDFAAFAPAASAASDFAAAGQPVGQPLYPGQLDGQPVGQPLYPGQLDGQPGGPGLPF